MRKRFGSLSRVDDTPLRTSHKLRDIAPGVELWRIGQDRLTEYTSLFAEVYDRRFAFHRERNRREIRTEYARLLERSVFLAMVKQGEIVTTGAGVFAFRRDLTPTLPRDVESIFDLPALANELDAAEIWYMSRFATRPGAVSREEARAILTAAPLAMHECIKHDESNVIVSLMEAGIVRLYRRIGIHWNILDTVEMPFGDGFRLHRAWIRAGDLT